jgi:murein DD-endopeptidase MepM/ murein hydrolase activator NlpD
VILNLGHPVPQTNTFDLVLDVPASLLRQLPADQGLRAFARVLQQNEFEKLDSYQIVPSDFDSTSRKLRLRFNKGWLIPARSGGGAYEAVVTIVTVPGGPPRSTIQQASGGTCQAKALGAPLGGPLIINGNPPRGFDPNPTTHPVNGSQTGHWGVDLKADQGTSVLAAEDGTIERVKYPGTPDKWGKGEQYVVIRHSDGSKTMYIHLSNVAVAVNKSVTKGQQIGLSGGKPGTPGAGSSTGPHLHFEYSPNGKIYNKDTTSKIDPFPCVTTSDAVGSILVNDNGPSNDDVFQVSLDSLLLGRTPKGGSDSFGLSNLRPGTKVLRITCLDTGGDIGTLGVALNDGVEFEDGGRTRSAELDLNETITYRIVVPSRASTQAIFVPFEPPRNPRPERGQ